MESDYPDPQGVRGRNSDDTRLGKVLSWESISLKKGQQRTYAWIEDQTRRRLAVPTGARGERG
jgi:GDP-D-mannose 3', 5'-epimerase